MARLTNIGGARSINAFVSGKLRRFEATDRSFSALYELMFSESGNTMFEESRGFSIIKTTYGEVKAQTEKLAGTMADLLRGLPGDSIVGLYMANSIGWVECLWAILMCGYRPLLMNTRMDGALLEQVLRECGAACVISDGKRFPVRTIVFDEIAVAEDAVRPHGTWGPELLLMSSGTTEHVKLCAYTAAEFCSQIQDSARIIRGCTQVKKHWKGELKLLTFLPFYHIFGLTAVYIWFAFFSRCFVLLKDFAPDTILNTVRRHEVTHIFAVPLLWERIYDEARKTAREQGMAKKLDLGLKLGAGIQRVPVLGPALCRRLFREVREQVFGESVLFTISGGSFIRPETLRFLNIIGYSLHNGYGMTEVGITSVVLSPRISRRMDGSIGKPLSSVSYRLNEQGVLQIRGTSTAARILCDGRELAREDGWYTTGDFAEEKNGRWFIRGRSDDVVIGTSGENLNPDLLEDGLNRATGALCSLIRGKQDEPTVLCSIHGHVSDENAATAREKLTGALRETGLASEIAAVVITADPLMGADDFKVSRTVLRRRYLNGEVTPYAAGARVKHDLSELEAIVAARVAAILGRDIASVGAEDNLFTDLGCNSLDYHALTAELEETFGRTLVHEDAAAPATVRAIAALLEVDET